MSDRTSISAYIVPGKSIVCLAQASFRSEAQTYGVHDVADEDALIACAESVSIRYKLSMHIFSACLPVWDAARDVYPVRQIGPQQTG